MEAKQFNVRMPLFAHEEFAQLRRALRLIGAKPTDGDFVAALIHRALDSVDETKAIVEAYVIFELAQEDALEQRRR
jgi:hypothetical protein